MYQKLFSKLKFIVIFSLFIFCVGSLSAKSLGTIYTTDGTKYESVSFSNNKHLKVISFKLKDEKIYISYTDIDRIYDKDDKDITKLVLGKYYDDSPPAIIQDFGQAESDKLNEKPKVKSSDKPKQKSLKKPIENREQWLSNRDNRVTEYNKKNWNIVLFAQPSYTMLSGKYYTGLESGGCFGGDIAIALTKEYSLRFSYGKAGVSVPDNFIIFELYDPFYEIIDQSIKYNSNRYFVSFQINKLFDPYGTENSFWYTYSGIGSVTEKTTMNITIRDTNTNLIGTDIAVLNDSFEAVRIGGGIVKSVTPQLGFNLEVSLDWVGAFSEEMDATLIDFKVGLALLL